jgi:hypothetical protein
MNIDLAQEIIGNIFKAAKGSKNKPYIDVEMQAWKFVRAWIKERRTVKASTPVQQRQANILLCGQPKKICVDYHHGRCNDPLPCAWQRKNSFVA